MTVISLSAEREARQPHWQGQATCLGCRHTWEAVAPMGIVDGLVCPACELPKGVVRNLWGAPARALVFRCNCGSEALTAYKRPIDGLAILRCIGCGEDQTNALFGE